MWLVGRIPVFTCCFKGVCRIAYCTVTVFMDMEAVGPMGSLSAWAGW
jgi:hypothetical protein